MESCSVVSLYAVAITVSADNILIWAFMVDCEENAIIKNKKTERCRIVVCVVVGVNLVSKRYWDKVIIFLRHLRKKTDFSKIIVRFFLEVFSLFCAEGVHFSIIRFLEGTGM